MDLDYLVIGAGIAGLSFTALLEKKCVSSGERIALLEAHSLVGGCASYFFKDGHHFDAGATTLSALHPGQPIYELIKSLDLKLDLRKIDPGLIFLFPDKKIFRHADHEQWKNELSKHFPQINHQKIWNRIEMINQKGWKLTSLTHQIPLRSFLDLFSLLHPRYLQSADLLLTLFRSVEDGLDLEKSNPQYRALINELLFITAQNHMNDTPLLMGAMGLSYPSDTHHVMGGMRALCLALKEKCPHLYLNQSVQEIKSIRGGFEVLTQKRTFTTKKIISTLPIWNNSLLLKNEITLKNENPDLAWSAFMLYLTIPKNQEREGLYYQIHCGAIPFCESESFFVSLSHPQDPTRSQTRQTVTISCHTKTMAWRDLAPEIYQHQKEVVAKFILNHLCQHFSLEYLDCQNIYTATPKTFIHYTQRFQGLVGGIPHSLKRNPLSYLSDRSRLKNFYQIGDTQFPGQGIAAVVLGSQNLISHLFKE
ncbi:MAG: FAD-dependent oxidoreductase [Bacteriovorax sp.]|nr:FAD-dependent oxidoreductase [Bacteriovorax sp.]